MRPIAWIAIAALTTATALVAAKFAADDSEEVPQAVHNARNLPNIEMLDQSGRSVRFYDDVVMGKSVVIQFMYTRCDGVCPVATGTLLEAQELLKDRLGKDLWFVSISLDERDTPQDLADYAESRGIGAGWTLLTGAAADVEALRRALGAYDPDPQIDQERSNHSAGLVLGNDRLDRWTMTSGLSPATAVVRSIRRTL
jgi:protein SCO1